MNILKNSFFVYAFLFFISGSALIPHVYAQEVSQEIDYTEELPFDPEVIKGRLNNGFEYYIRENKEPENRVTMYLALKVGSILEDEKQLGLAHFLEHMNFNGLKHFPKNELVDYLQKAGVRFGSDLNAYTSFDATVYQLPIPSDDPELLENGLQVMRDWAQDALLDPEEIDKERGVVLEELRSRLGAMQRMQDQFLPMLFDYSRYAERLPIGKKEVLENFDHSELKRFHQDWYRPDLMSIIIVGDIDSKEMVTEVERLFSDLKEPEQPKERKEYSVDLKNDNGFMTVTDSEMPQTVVQIIAKQPELKIKNIGDYRISLMRSVMNQMISARYHEIIQEADAPFVQAGAGIEGFMGGLDNLSMYFVAKNDEFEQGFKTLVREMERVKKFGFTETEFARAVASIEKSNEKSYIERDKKKSQSYVNTYLNHFLEEDPALGNEDKFEIVRDLLPTLTLKEVEEVFEQFYQDKNRDIIILAPEKEEDALPGEEQVLTWIDEVQSEELQAYEDNVSDLPLLKSEPEKGSIVDTEDYDAIGVTKLSLSNGVQVYLKPTAFKNDEILISAFSEGGTSLYADEDYFSANYASSLINSSGLGQFTNVELGKFLSDKSVNISPYISQRSEGLSGNSDKENLEVAFQMIYGYFKEPMIEQNVFQSYISRLVSSMRNNEDDPSYVFRKETLNALYNGNIRRVPPEIEQIKNIDKERALEIYKDRFADASDFNFVFVGSFEEDDLIPYIEQYLAGLPTMNRDEKAKDLGIVEPEKGFEKIVKKGKEDKATVQMAYYTDYEYSKKENINLDALSSVLSIKLIEQLREEESGVYGVGARASYSKEPTERLSFYIGFGTGSDKVKPLLKTTLLEINKIKENGPTQVDVDKFKKEEHRQNEVNLKENRYWLNQIVSTLQLEKEPESILEYLDLVDNVSVESIKEVANKYLTEEKLFKFILMPEKE
ncbi:MAG TPA: insulinase family protein [Sphingobacterium sp.]|nr:insulinase family protein [Sphingobacterium sp.]